MADPQRQLRSLREMRPDFERRVRDAEGALEGLDRAIAALSEQVAAERRIAPLEGVADAVRTILADGPLHRNEIMERLDARGIHVEGEKPLSGLSSIMSRARDMESYGDGRWGLKNAPESASDQGD